MSYLNEDLRPLVIGVNTTLILMSILAVGCRVGRKIRVLNSFSWHDGLITFTAICAIMFSIILMACTRHGAGRHQELLSPEDLTKFLQLVMAAFVFYFTCNWCVKHSLLFFYSELTFDYWPRVCIYFMHFVAFAFGATCVVTSIFQCTPVRKFWDLTTPGTCIDMNAFNYFNSCFMLGNDVFLYAMPIIFTWKVQLRRPNRIAVNFLFALGGIVLAASAVRVYFSHMQAVNPDFPFKMAAATTCAVIENHLAVIVACAPSIKAVTVQACPGLSSKFEQILNDEHEKRGGYRYKGYKRGQADTLDPESANSEMQKEGVKLSPMRPTASRILTGYSGKTERSERSARSGESRMAMGRWWRAPSSWAVDSV
ncbi:integral membrane [Pyrenophora seminiperda CCB06]|uniref:Integral membrane n=1 Tax=Pyrenophora seminiperda CCB06 TaxID=1302712 RepID=A0A3M7LVJ7_9PLEO|nr:integral membrane [Pyrenophora seminiperda CCB06]